MMYNVIARPELAGLGWPASATQAGGGVSDCYQQAKLVLLYIEDALNRAGASLNDVVRTRAFLTDISKAEEYGRAHGEVFGEIRPAATLVEVSALVHPDLVVEIEVDAIVSGG